MRVSSLLQLTVLSVVNVKVLYVFCSLLHISKLNFSVFVNSAVLVFALHMRFDLIYPANNIFQVLTSSITLFSNKLSLIGGLGFDFLSVILLIIDSSRDLNRSIRIHPLKSVIKSVLLQYVIDSRHFPPRSKIESVFLNVSDRGRFLFSFSASDKILTLSAVLSNSIFTS